MSYVPLVLEGLEKARSYYV